MTKEELTENVAKCYNSLPDKSEDAMKTLISTIAYFIAMNVNREESSIDEVITYFRNALVYGWNYKLASDDLQFISEYICPFADKKRKASKHNRAPMK